MKHAFATFVFIAGSIAAFAGSAYALPLPVNPFAEAARGEAVINTPIALDQGANQWNHFIPRGGFKVALDQGANQWNHRDDDSRVNPRLVL